MCERERLEAHQEIGSKGAAKYKQETPKAFQSRDSRYHILNLHRIIYPNHKINQETRCTGQEERYA